MRLQIWFLISAFCPFAYGNGQLSVVHYPKSLEFKGNDEVEASSAGDVLAAACGYSVVGNSNWSAMTIRNPFDMPRGCFALYFQNSDVVPTSPNVLNTFNLTGSGSQISIWNALHRIPKSLEIDLNNDVSEKITWDTFRPVNSQEEKDFWRSMAALNALIDKLSTMEGLPPLWIARLRSADSLISSSSSSSLPTSVRAEAKRIQAAAIEKLIATLKNKYDGIFIAFIADQERKPQIRHRRQYDASQTEDEGEGEGESESVPEPPSTAFDHYINQLHDNDNYPVIFNICLWFGVSWVFAVIAISYTIGFMDPGRDSIIYRMTSTRMIKKEN